MDRALVRLLTMAFLPIAPEDLAAALAERLSGEVCLLYTSDAADE